MKMHKMHEMIQNAQNAQKERSIAAVLLSANHSAHRFGRRAEKLRFSGLHINIHLGGVAAEGFLV